MRYGDIDLLAVSSYLPCGSYHLAGDGRIASYRMRRGEFAVSSRCDSLGGTAGGTRGGTAGEEGRGEAMGGTKNGTTAIKQSSRRQYQVD